MIRGIVHRYGSNVDTDVIIPARYLNTASEEELAAHCMEDIDPAFRGRVKAGDILVAEDNFGCGSSREHAPIAMPSISGFPFSNAPRPSETSEPGTPYPAILQRARSETRRRVRSFMPSPSPHSFRKSSTPAD